MELVEVAGQVVPGLWVSGMPAEHWDLDGWGISLVVSLSEHLPPQAARRFEWGTPAAAVGNGRVVYLHWPIEDGDVPDGLRAGVVVATVTHAVQAGLPTLVHCYEGRNRSGLIAALAARQLTGCTGLEAVDLVRAARPGMLANRQFLQALSGLSGGAPRRP